MIKTASLVILIALRLAYQPAWQEQGIAPFSDQPVLISTTEVGKPAKLITFSGQIQDSKVLLEWTVEENETADQFLVERSKDGKNYDVAAYVFGTDQPAIGRYRFYEKAGNQKLHYRIRLINKNNQTEFSSALEIQPGA
jgi:hypothetical protein